MQAIKDKNNVRNRVDEVTKCLPPDMGYFILACNGIVLSCNEQAAAIFKFNAPDDLEGVHLKELVPEEFAEHLPEHITEHHLTKDSFFARVNRCSDGSLISTLVKTCYVVINRKTYLECFIKLNDNQVASLDELLLRQNNELLQCELMRLKTIVEEVVVKTDSESVVRKALSSRFPKLTRNDLQFCEYIINGLSTKEIADKMCIAETSAYKFRKRLRKKLNLAADVNLISFLSALCKA